jgi:Holliday junction resolvase RusA-like endonuclease
VSRSLAFWVDGVPVPKQRARTVRTKTGKVVSFTPKRTARWENVVRLVAQAECSAAKWKPSPGAYDVTIEVYPARRAGDADNFAKAVTDAMNGVVYPDDRSIRKLTVERRDVGVALGVLVRVSRGPKE